MYTYIHAYVYNDWKEIPQTLWQHGSWDWARGCPSWDRQSMWNQRGTQSSCWTLCRRRPWARLCPLSSISPLSQDPELFNICKCGSSPWPTSSLSLSSSISHSLPHSGLQHRSHLSAHLLTLFYTPLYIPNKVRKACDCALYRYITKWKCLNLLCKAHSLE